VSSPVVDPPPRREPPPPTSWLAPAIFATLCLFPPTGVVGVYFAAQVRSLWAVGQRREAARCARMARVWTLVSLALWVVFSVIVVATGRAGRLLEAGVL